jgi:catechol 2,3-dioxygenase-like lactoylglutathione lyase family enzyme
MKDPQPVPHHLAFLASDEEFDAILERVTEHGLKFGSGPGSTEDMKVAQRNGGRGFYFKDPNGHSYELMTSAL